MTTGEYLVANSTLPSGTALQHLLALQIGTGSGQTVFASQFLVSIEEPRADAAFVTKTSRKVEVVIRDSVAASSEDENSLFCAIGSRRMFVTTGQAGMVAGVASQRSFIAQRQARATYSAGKGVGRYVNDLSTNSFVTIK